MYTFKNKQQPVSVSCVLFSQGLSGGTTVSATMIAAHRAGIPVFVTGGVGGVHRDGQNSEQIYINTLHILTLSYYFQQTMKTDSLTWFWPPFMWRGNSPHHQLFMSIWI